jgi:hypothetical protein
MFNYIKLTVCNVEIIAAVPDNTLSELAYPGRFKSRQLQGIAGARQFFLGDIQMKKFM